MTNPEPSETTGLEPGGGVPPGETPPAETAMSGLSHPQPMPGKAFNRVAVAAIVLFVLFVLGFLIARLADVL